MLRLSIPRADNRQFRGFRAQNEWALVDPARDLVVIVPTQRLFESAQAPTVHADLQAAAFAAVG